MSAAIEVLNNVRQSAEKIKNDADQHFPEAASVGDYWRQGDIYITLIGELQPQLVGNETEERQLAPGNTQGSRHIAEGDCTVYSRSGSPLEGPIIEVRKGAAITHPEHGNVHLPTGVYSITYQRAYAEELRRVQD